MKKPIRIKAFVMVKVYQDNKAFYRLKLNNKKRFEVQSSLVTESAFINMCDEFIEDYSIANKNERFTFVNMIK